MPIRTNDRAGGDQEDESIERWGQVIDVNLLGVAPGRQTFARPQHLRQVRAMAVKARLARLAQGGRPVTDRGTRRNILITGASSGLGEGMARLFAARGRNLALTARRVERLEALRSELLEQHPGISVAVHKLDVNDSDAVFRVFAACRDQLGGLDRIIVNAGVGKGARIGTGRFDANRETAMTNFVAALAQCEAAMEIFHAADAGHLVVVSSMSAFRGMPGSMTTYAATKAGIATLAEGIRSDCLRKPIRVTTLYPGYIRSQMNERVEQEPGLMVDTETGCRALVAAIEKEPAEAEVPAWPWKPIGYALRHLPLQVVRRMV